MSSPAENLPLPISLINAQELLDEALIELAAAPVWAFDLEFDRDRYSYGFNLCLIQIATPDVVFIIDPLAIADLQPLFREFEHSAALKLCYSCGEDLRLLHSLKCYPTHIADVEIYAKLLNYDKTSMANMLLLLMNVEISKSLQKINWGNRPMSSAQVQYAAGDVIWLMELHRLLVADADEKGVGFFAQQEQILLNEQRYDLTPKTYFLKPNDEKYLSPHRQYVLNAAFAWRDDMARNFNKPAHQIMSEDTLRMFVLDEIGPTAFLDQSGLHPQLRKPLQMKALYAALSQWHAEAANNGLSKKREFLEPTSSPAIREERARNKMLVWQPIQQHIMHKYGENAMRSMLSSTLVDGILNGKTSISQLKPPYKQALIHEAAEVLGVAVSLWQ